MPTPARISPSATGSTNPPSAGGGSRILIGYATRTGTYGTSADAAAHFTTADLSVGAAVVDGIGHSDALHTLVPHVAVTAARIAAVSGAPAGLLTGGGMMSTADVDGARPNAVAVVAHARPGSPTTICWTGDSRASGWDGVRLTAYTVDQTVATYLLEAGVAEEIAAGFRSRLKGSLAEVVPETASKVLIPAGQLVILTSDGIHDQVLADVMEALVHQHQDDPQALAEALVAAAAADGTGYRDDATAIVLHPGSGLHPGH
ncbi:hypothetical protein [Streptomyces sp. NPDC059247]|uniref:hypothetical protein n=1 Tax=Streptomyces sp. NPDC059247 TaxID=3346790 RepID=UPI0036BFC693